MTAAVATAPRIPAPGTVSDQLVEGIIRTVAYADVFDFPLRPDELHRYLIGVPARREEVDAGLQRAHWDGRVTVRDGYAALPWRGGLVDARRRRDPGSARDLRRAARYARAVGSLPFVRMVAISGAVAAGNGVADDDIDLFVITAQGRLWSARAGSIAVVRLVARLGDELCPNYLLSESALELDDRDLYAATELAHLVPVVGRPLYGRLRLANPWTSDLLPNADGSPSAIDGAAPVGGWLKVTAEALLRTAPGAALEAWERDRKVTRFRARAAGSAEAWLDTAFGADRCKGHFESHRTRIREAYERRSRDAGVEPIW